MSSSITREQQEALVAALRTKRDMRQLLRQWRDCPDRRRARIADRALVSALKDYSAANLSQRLGVSKHTVNRYMQKVLLREELPAAAPPPVDWDAVDAEIRMGWHLDALARSIGPQYIMEKYKVSRHAAETAGEFLSNARPQGGYKVMASASPELREAVIQARNEYKATVAKRMRFTYEAIGERHGRALSTIGNRARMLREQEDES